MVYNLVDFETNQVHMYNIKPDTTVKKKYYCVMANPFTNFYTAKILFGSTEEIVGRKIEKQFRKFKESVK